MPFEFRRLEIPDVIFIQPGVFADRRGVFSEIYKSGDFAKAGIECEFVQDNYSQSGKNILRGLHYQLNPKAQSKLVTAMSGVVFDVAVDIRKGSPYYGRWVGCTLRGEKKESLFLPCGFAHGFCVLSDRAEVMYKASSSYSPDHERGIIWNDPVIAVDWPVKDPILSERDAKLPSLKDAENNLVYGDNSKRGDPSVIEGVI